MTREESIKYLKGMKDECNDTFHKVRYVTQEEALDMAIKALEPKVGRWIERRNRATGRIESVCSECGAEEGYPYNIYCGNCGCRMVEPQESEEGE